MNRDQSERSGARWFLPTPLHFLGAQRPKNNNKKERNPNLIIKSNKWAEKCSKKLHDRPWSLWENSAENRGEGGIANAGKIAFAACDLIR